MAVAEEPPKQPHSSMNARILMVVNIEWYFRSHRLGLAKALSAHGFDVTVAASVERGEAEAIRREGVRFLPLSLRRRSTNPAREMLTIAELVRLYRRERPDLVHHVTVKPILYGSMAARLAGTPAQINAIPGLGYLFLGEGFRGRLRRRFAMHAYQWALAGQRSRTIFQNAEDRRLFIERGVVQEDQAVLIRGAGVDLGKFLPHPEPTGPPCVMLASRLLWDKGVADFVEAMRRLKRQGLPCRGVLVGKPDTGNPHALPRAVLKQWEAEGVVELWGHQTDMPSVLSQAAVVVLPTFYPEGLPKILLEAAAAARAIVATDVPGCREIVRHGENGLLVPTHDPAALTDALAGLLRDPARRASMGRAGRLLAEAEFSEDDVYAQTIQVYRDLLGS
jgi:glycosyltransferase involved in cell wall biosynthesis